jgi:hypothetical protein
MRYLWHRFLRWLGVLPPLPNFSEIVLTTIRNHPEIIESIVTKNNALFRQLKDRKL